MSKFTPGKWDVSAKRKNLVIGPRGHALADCKFSHSVTNRQLPTASECIANARLIAAAPEMLKALHEGRRAIGDHHRPDDCYATGPVTGDAIRDLVQCPACSFIAAYDAAIAKATEPQS